MINGWENKKLDNIDFCDAYEYSMAKANKKKGKEGKQCIFNASLREMPTNKIIGYFKKDGVQYPYLKQRNYMINAGLERIVGVLSPFFKSDYNRFYDLYSDEFTTYLSQNFNWDKLEVKNFITDVLFNFNSDIYAMEEGVPFFHHQPLIKVEGDFESSQLLESIILSILNRSVNVVTSAHDIYLASNEKILLEGGSRRSFGPEDSVNLSRSALIGGFTASSNIKFGHRYDKPAGGTHGHSYVLLYDSEYEAFKAQSETHGDNATFLLDTYDVEEALEIALRVIKEDERRHFGFRIDSGDLLKQAKWIHKKMKEEGYERSNYTIFASDDLDAGKIKYLEENGADIDKYLIGTYLSMQPKNPGIVYKISAKEKNNQWIPTFKKSSSPQKSTLGGNIQVYRIEGEDGFYKRDYIACADEDISSYLKEDEIAHPLLKKIFENGNLIYNFPTLDQIIEKRKKELNKFNDIENYEVFLTNKIKEENGRK